MLARYWLAVVASTALASPAFAQFLPKPLPAHTHAGDIIYGHKDGVALTMDVYTPQKANGLGVIICVSMNYESSQAMLKVLHDYAMRDFLNSGYVVFAVLHGSQPKFSIPEIVDDMHRAVRFIKHNAGKYGVKADKLGITGGSSGGHLALMMGCNWRLGKTGAADPVEAESSQVAAVACFFPPTNFPAYEGKAPKGFDPTLLFPFRELKPKAPNEWVIVSAERRREIGTACSPLFCARKNAAPTLIVHGDADKIVPIQQSRELNARFKVLGATSKLVEVPGMEHRLIEAIPHIPKLVKWFDEYLK